jgi:hypothetical protein
LLDTEKQREENELQRTKNFEEFKSRWTSKEAEYKGKLEVLNNQIKADKV